MQKILIIQTAFIGDVILATPIAEKLHARFPQAQIDFVVRKGNEPLFEDHPFIKNVFVWNKKQNKMAGLLKLVLEIRKQHYDLCINLQRFFSSGVIAALAGAKEKRGFLKNPLSFFYDKSFKHELGNGKHEVERNISIIEDLTDGIMQMPKLYPSNVDSEFVRTYQKKEYVCMAPASIWFTKQLPISKWVELSLKLQGKKIYMLGAKGDITLCESIKQKSGNADIEILCGKLSFLQSAALMKGAIMNYVNDSAPLHLCSSVDAPVTAFFCSTIPEFGFGPLSTKSLVIETKEKLPCRSCGLHGYKNCPEGHYKCAHTIIIGTIEKLT